MTRAEIDRCLSGLSVWFGRFMAIAVIQAISASFTQIRAVLVIRVLQPKAETKLAGPNPYHSQTKIQFSNPKQQRVNVKVINITGQITSYEEKELNAGTYELDINGGKGLQFIVITTPDTIMSTKIIGLGQGSGTGVNGK